MATMTERRMTRLILFAGLLSGVVWSVPVQAGQSELVKDVVDGRLPRDVIPRHYNIELQGDIYSSPEPPFYFGGRVTIYVTCAVATNSVVLNAKNIDFTTVQITADPNSPVSTPSPILLQRSYDPSAEFLTIQVVNALVPGADYIIRILYNGQLRSDGSGLYWDGYQTADGSTKYIMATEMWPHAARTVFPSFDESDLKATFNVTVISKAQSVTLSNMPLIGSEIWSGDWIAYTFDTSPVMSTYQICVIVGDLIYVEADWENVTSYPVRIYGRPEVANQLNFAAKVAPKLQAWLEEETGIPYTLPKMDHVALPSKGGAMENWGLITYSEYYLCVDEQTSAATGRLDVASVISHELAHQWYGNLVTPKWWNDVWLSEGFATFYNYYTQLALGWEGSEAQQGDRRSGTQQFLDVDMLNTSDPIRKNIASVWQASSSLAGSTYPKGGAMLRMLKGILSPATFKRGLTSYLTKYMYSTAESDDLWAELSAQAAIDGVTYPDGSALNVKAIMDPWLNQMGYPLLVVGRNGDATATVTSRRFLSPRGQTPNTPSDFDYSWNVPITLATPQTTNLDATPTFYMPLGESTITIDGVPTTPGDWIMINVKQTGFYRVDYDSFLRDDIVAQLNTSHTVIPVESRAQFIDDSFTLARSLNLPVSYAMDTTLYLSRETQYNPWSVFLKHALYLDNFIWEALWRPLYRSYIVNTLLPVYNVVGWTYSSSESLLQQLVRREVIIGTCYYGSLDCRNVANTQYQTYIANPEVNSVNANNLPTVLCTGIAEGTSADWSMAFDQYLLRKLSPIREERQAYLFGMACIADTQWHDRLLSYIIGGSLIDPRDANAALTYMTQSRTGRPVVWTYLTNTWRTVPSFVNKISIMQNIVNTYYDPSRLDELNNFIANFPPQSQREQEAFRRMQLTITQNIDFASAGAQGLLDWLVANPTDLTQRSLDAPLPISPQVFWDSQTRDTEAY